MGHVVHHMIVVTTFTNELASKARIEALGLALLPTEIVRSRVNSYCSFFIPTDGSKSGWTDSDDGDTRRAEFIKWLNAQRYGDGSSPYEWVEMSYGSDDAKAQIANTAWKRQRKAKP